MARVLVFEGSKQTWGSASNIVLQNKSTNSKYVYNLKKSKSGYSRQNVFQGPFAVNLKILELYNFTVANLQPVFLLLQSIINA